MSISMLDLPLKRADNTCMINEMKEEMAQQMYRRSREVAKAGGQCVKCGAFDLKFRDDLSQDEYHISVWCQDCQDDFFGA